MIINILKAMFKFIFGIVLVPLTISVSRAFYTQFSNLSVLEPDIIPGNQHYFLYGVAIYIVMHLFFFKPRYFYNLGHEVVHILFTWLSLGRAKNLKISDQGGSVQTTKSNVFINISPYFVPIYTLILCLAYFIISRFTDISTWAPLFVFFIGFTFAMHIVMTVEVLKLSQPDLLKTGYLFSLSIIYVFNVLLAGFIIGLIFAGFSFVDMFLQFYYGSKELYLLIFRQLFSV